MLFPHARGLTAKTANAIAAMGLGVFIAFVGLNVAAGCGQGGECLTPAHFDLSSAHGMLAQAD
ncbi:hypothetical protein [Telmatospirillum sp. J64-1]|uniref:hypothetical protein n=1 Tax=Telmatospirillum sp. J64-1 TaxID=2502183 RepID=UPI00115E4220|nr:hypothetical protein [Telmatospirillum sp. J64-1]